MNILIAEDDATSRKLLELSLRQWGHRVIVTADGAAALEAWSCERFDVVITDWMMPNVDGIELVRRIREQETRLQRYTWTVLLTTKAFQENYAVAMEAGVDDFLTKPLDRELLRVRLSVAARVLGMRQKLSEIEAIIPICMHCKSIRNSPQHWQRVEEYLAAHVSTSISHGYCPDCYLAESVLPEIARIEALHGAPRPAGAGAVDPAALSFLQAHEAESPNLAGDLVRAFVDIAAGMDGLLARNSSLDRTKGPVFRFGKAARRTPLCFGNKDACLGCAFTDTLLPVEAGAAHAPSITGAPDAGESRGGARCR